MTTSISADHSLPVAAVTHKRYLLCGLSSRSLNHFALPLLGKASAAHANDFTDCATLPAVVDIDEERVAAFNARYGTSLRWYPPERLGEAITAERIDTVLVAGPDDTHFAQIMAALDAGCDVIAEKPMVISSEQARQVIAREKATGRTVEVSFNMRYKPLQRAIRRELMRGAIGQVVNLDFNYQLNTEHGSSYFFRWNRRHARSGGLNIHKSCHHLDVINWWLDDVPESLFAFGDRRYFGANGAHRPRGPHGEPLSLVETKNRCPYFRHHLAAWNDVNGGRIRAVGDHIFLPMKEQYPESRPAYLYDEEIDIDDVYCALLRYRQGAMVTYSINFSTPWEGVRVAINGTHGRIEGGYRVGSSNDPAHCPQVRVHPLFGKAYDIPLSEGVGGHGGADEPCQRDLFREVSPEALELSLVADSRAGAYAVAAGEAIWQSSRSGQPVKLPHF